MIRYVDDTLLEQLQQFLTEHRSIYACRIGCCLQSYGLRYPFASFYLQINEQDNVIGAAADYYHDLTLLLTAESDLDEWRCWAEMTGFHSLLWGLGVTVLVQQIEGYFLSPRLMGEATGLHPVSVLLLLSAGGLLFGLGGMVAAVPAYVCLRGAARVLWETGEKEQ